MQGNREIRFSELFIDTVNANGIDWAYKHYRKGGMSEWEFWFWIAATANSLVIG